MEHPQQQPPERQQPETKTNGAAPPDAGLRETQVSFRPESRTNTDQPQPDKRRSKNPLVGILLIVAGLAVAANWFAPHLFGDAFDLLGASVLGIVIALLGAFFIVGQFTPNRNKPYRIGRLTTGIVFLWAGAGLAVPQLLPDGWFGIAATLWPAVIIGFGLEYLWRKNGSAKSKFDLAGIFLMLIVFAITTGSLLDRTFSVLGSSGGHAIRDTPIVVAPASIESLAVEGQVGTITVVPATDGRITITPTYRSWRDQSLAQFKEAVRVEVTEDGGRVKAIVREEARRSDNRLFDMPSVSVDLLIAAPADTPLEGKTEVGNIKVQGFRNVRSLQASIGTIALTDSQGDARLRLSIGEIEVRNFSGKVAAENSIGRVAVHGEPTDDWTLGTHIGTVEAYVPEAGNYRFELSSDIGSEHIPNSPENSGNTATSPVRQLKLNTSIGTAEAKYQ